MKDLTFFHSQTIASHMIGDLSFQMKESVRIATEVRRFVFQALPAPRDRRSLHKPSRDHRYNWT